MQYRAIAGTDLEVSVLGFGNFVFGSDWWGTFADEDGVKLQNQAVDQGVNFFDSAPAYGNGRAERLLAETIRYAGRERLVVGTKFGYDIDGAAGEKSGQRERPQNFTARYIRQELEQSLRRLGVDRIDLYQAHNLKLPDFTDELFGVMEDLTREGKVRYWGVALGPAIGWREEGHEAFVRGAQVVQTVFNLYEQDPGREFCQTAQRLGRGGVIARVPTNSGMLDEEFTSPEHKFAPGDHRKFRDKNWLIYGLKKNEMLCSLAGELGCSLRQLSFQWLLSHPTLVSVEPNLLTGAELEDYARAADGLALPADALGQITRLYESDFGLGAPAHPCDWKSSVAPGGRVPSTFQESPIAPVTGDRIPQR